jgi:RNA polymerase sigma-70 factor, ECF subfamily
MQQLAVALLTKFAEYDPQRPFVAWAIRFAYLETLKWRQQQARSRLVFSDALLAQLDQAICEEAPLLELRRQALDHCLDKLSDTDRQLLLRRYSQHGAIEQESQHTGTSVHRLYRIVEKLRGVLLQCIQTTLAEEGWDHA